jgi:hypothetical protein
MGWLRPYANFCLKGKGALIAVLADALASQTGVLGRKFGAGDRDRTGDVQLGKLAFYR